MLGCSFFTLFPFTLSFLWEHSFVVPPDLSVSVACCSFFCSSLAMQFLFARLDGTRLEDQIYPFQKFNGNNQWSIRLMNCVMVVTAINLGFLDPNRHRRFFFFHGVFRARNSVIAGWAVFVAGHVSCCSDSFAFGNACKLGLVSLHAPLVVCLHCHCRPNAFRFQRLAILG